MIISFTGRRPQFLGGYDDSTNLSIPIKNRLKELLIEFKPTKCLSGMACGLDTWSFEVCLELKIPVDACIPFVGQEKTWPKEVQAKYHNYLKLANQVVIVSEGGYANWKFQKRNEYLVDNCEKLIAVYNGSGGKGGGTANCIDYAKSKNKDILIINSGDLLCAINK